MNNIANYKIKVSSIIQLIWTVMTCWIISSFNGGFVTLLPYSSWILVFPIWFLFSVIINGRFLLFFWKTGWALIIFEIMVIIFSIFESTAVNVTSRSFMGIVVAYAIFCFLYTNPWNWIKPIVGFYFIEMFFQLVYAIKMLFSNPTLIRGLLTSTIDAVNYPFMISFAGVYISMAIMIYIIVQFKYINKTYKLPCLLLVILQVVLVLMSNLATPLIISATFIGLSILFKNKKKLIFSFVILLIFYSIFKTQIGNIFVTLSQGSYFSTIISDKLYELGYYLQGKIVNNASGTYAVRQELSKQSMASFYDHFLLGVYGMGYDAKVGGHTTWQDLLGNFGILRTMFLFIFLYQWYRNLMMKFIREEENNATFYALIILVTAGFFNPVIKLGIVVFIFLVMPFTGQVLNKYNENRESES